MLEIIPFDAELNSKEIIKLAKLFVPKSIYDNINEWKYRIKLLIRICNKLQIPLDYVRDENQCNPLHILLKDERFYNNHVLKNIKLKEKLAIIIRDLQNTCLVLLIFTYFVLFIL